jgi:hypothetical protein
MSGDGLLHHKTVAATTTTAAGDTPNCTHNSTNLPMVNQTTTAVAENTHIQASRHIERAGEICVYLHVIVLIRVLACFLASLWLQPHYAILTPDIQIRRVTRARALKEEVA